MEAICCCCNRKLPFTSVSFTRIHIHTILKYTLTHNGFKDKQLLIDLFWFVMFDTSVPFKRLLFWAEFYTRCAHVGKLPITFKLKLIVEPDRSAWATSHRWHLTVFMLFTLMQITYLLVVLKHADIANTQRQTQTATFTCTHQVCHQFISQAWMVLKNMEDSGARDNGMFSQGTRLTAASHHSLVRMALQ